MAISRVYTPCFARSVTHIPGGMKMGIWASKNGDSYSWNFLNKYEPCKPGISTNGGRPTCPWNWCSAGRWASRAVTRCWGLGTPHSKGLENFTCPAVDGKLGVCLIHFLRVQGRFLCIPIISCANSSKVWATEQLKSSWLLTHDLDGCPLRNKVFQALRNFWRTAPVQQLPGFGCFRTWLKAPETRKRRCGVMVTGVPRSVSWTRLFSGSKPLFWDVYSN